MTPKAATAYVKQFAHLREDNEEALQNWQSQSSQQSVGKFRLRLFWGQGNEEFELRWLDDETWECLISMQPNITGTPVVYHLHANEIRVWPDIDGRDHLIVKIEQVV
jgi:hypothetical protein